jgi:hypothetical protein
VKKLISTRAERAQIKRIQKYRPGLTVDGARQSIKADADRDKEEKATALHAWNVQLKNLGYGVKRGLFMETPKGMVDGVMKFNWGPMLHYAGIGQERIGGFDGEGGYNDGQSDGLLIAHGYALAHDLYHRHLSWPGEAIGTKAKSCPGCGRPFVGRNQAKTCSSKCRKRLERSIAKAVLQGVTVPPKR